jgi:hypothetical protein
MFASSIIFKNNFLSKYYVLKYLEMSSNINIDEVAKVAKIILEQFKQNIKDLETFTSILESFQDQAVLNLPDQPDQPVQPEQVVESMIETTDPIDPDTLLEDDNEVILNRRIELHKELGTYQEPVMITPLHKLNDKEQENLYKRIYEDAVQNMIDTNSEKTGALFRAKVKDEADRLLSVWMSINK